MRCPTCGASFASPTRFCPTDGATLVADAGASAASAQTSPLVPFALGLVVALTLAAVAGGAFWLGAGSAPRPIETASALSTPGEPFGEPSPGGIQPVAQQAETSAAVQAAERAARASERSAAAAERMAGAGTMVAEYGGGTEFGGDGYDAASGLAIMGGLFDVPGNARRRAEALSRAGFEVRLTPASVYRGYDSGQTLVTLGPFTRAEARRLLPSVRRVVPDAFTKDLTLR